MTKSNSNPTVLLEALPQNTNTNSKPSDLNITDMRVMVMRADKPGLGITLNEAACKQHVAEPGWFEPTDQWNSTGRTNDRLWS